MIWLFASRPVLSVPSLRLVRFHRIGLRAVCAVFVSSFSSLASLVISWRRGISFSFPSRPSSRLSRLVWRLVFVLCGLFAYPFHLVGPLAARHSVSPGGSFSSCLLFLGVSSCPVHLVSVSSYLVLLMRLARAVCVFVSLGRLVGRVVFLRLILPILGLSVSCVSCPWGWAAARLAYASWRRASFPVVIRHRGVVAMAGWACSFDDTE